MNIAISRNMKRVVFIHGVGAGVLREEIRTELRSIYPQYEFLGRFVPTLWRRCYRGAVERIILFRKQGAATQQL